MKKGLNKNLFFSMTLDFLEKYIPQAPRAGLKMNKKEGFASKSFFFIQQSAVGG